MKITTTQTIAIAILSLLFAVISTNAQTAHAFSITIPFDFFVGDKWMARGKYLIKPANPVSENGAFMIVDDMGRSGMIVLAMNTEMDRTQALSQLQFNRYGGQYYLSRVAAAGFASLLRKTAAEKEIAAKNHSKTEMVAAKPLR